MHITQVGTWKHTTERRIDLLPEHRVEQSSQDNYKIVRAEDRNNNVYVFVKVEGGHLQFENLYIYIHMCMFRISILAITSALHVHVKVITNSDDSTFPNICHICIEIFL